MNVAIILAGGVGTRIGVKIPKQFIKVFDKPVMAYTLEAFQNNGIIDAIEVVCHKDWIDEVCKIKEQYSLTKIRWIVEGGNDFQQSAINGLTYINNELAYDDTVCFSFAVSPLTTDESITDSILTSKKYGNGIASDDISLCTCIKDREHYSTHNISREKLKAFSNPWSFQVGELIETYQTAKDRGILNKVDPHITSLYLELGKKIFFSKSSPYNFKITYKEDLDIFEGLLLLRKERIKDDNL